MEKMKKTAGILDTAARVCSIMCSIMAAAVLVAGVLLLIFGIDAVEVDGSVTLGPLELELAPGYIPDASPITGYILSLQGTALIAAVFGWLVIRVIRKLLAPMKEGRPFDTAVSDSFRCLAWITLIGGAVISVIRMVGDMVLFRAYDLASLFTGEAIVRCSLEHELDMTFVVVFGVLYLLSLVFRYGEELQQQSDETL